MKDQKYITLSQWCEMLPHKVECQWHTGDTGILLGVDILEGDNGYFREGICLNVTASKGKDWDSVMPAHVGQIKPYLRPLSSAHSEGEGGLTSKDIINLPYPVMHDLLRGNYDIRGLIKLGLALDIKTKPVDSAVIINLYNKPTKKN